MSKVKCKYCKIEFDKDKEAYEKIGNRYAHTDCCTEDNDEYMWDKVRLYAKKQLGESYNYGKVGAQIKRFETKLYFKPKYVLQALIYWYEVQGASPEKANGGIAIVENIYQEAREYYENKQYRLNQVANCSIKDYVKRTDEKIEVEWEPPVRPKNYHIIDLS